MSLNPELRRTTFSFPCKTHGSMTVSGVCFKTKFWGFGGEMKHTPKKKEKEHAHTHTQKVFVFFCISVPPEVAGQNLCPWHQRTHAHRPTPRGFRVQLLNSDLGQLSDAQHLLANVFMQAFFPRNDSGGGLPSFSFWG